MVSVAGLLMESAAAGGFICLERIERFLVFVFLGLVSVDCLFMVSVTFVYGFRYDLLWFPSLDCWLILPPQKVQYFKNVSSDSSFDFVVLGLASVDGFLYRFRRGLFLLVVMVSVVVLFFMVSVVARTCFLCFMVSVVGVCFVNYGSGCYRTAAFSRMETVTKTIRTFP